MENKFKKLSWEEFHNRCSPSDKHYWFEHQYHKGLNRSLTKLFNKVGLSIEQQYDNLKINYKNYLELDYIY